MNGTDAHNPADRPLGAVILAAGLGKRMRSDLPKVLHAIGGRPMLMPVIDACQAAGCARVVVVVGHKRELVTQAVAHEAERRAGLGEPGWADGIEFVVQEEQLGTGHAVMVCEEVFADQIGRGVGTGDVFVLAGDGPLIRESTLTQLVSLHRESGARATLATSVIENPAGYGRIVRDDAGGFARIVEQKEATPEELEIREVNPSYYCFDVASLFATLKRVKPAGGDGGEYYVTDVPGLLKRAGERVEVVAAVPPEDVLSINTPEQLAEVDAIFRSRGVGVVGEGA